MKILNPVSKGILSQPYGANADFYQKNFGIKFHNGADLVSFHGDKLYSPEDGVAYKIYDLSHGSVTKGFGVCILGNPDENGICNEHVLWHTMSNVIPKQGDKVRQGDVLAYEGGSGQVYLNNIAVLDSAKGKAPWPGTHLHWGKRQVKRFSVPLNSCLSDVNGLPYKDADGNFYNIQDYDNGVCGFIDPLGTPVIQYGDWLVEKTIPVITEAINLIPEVSELQKQGFMEAIKNLLQTIFNFLKGRIN